jgi:Cof subfamily protein (haloacid dehalogenase superfamily)
MRYRLLALDIDGTLLDPHGALRPTVQQAVTAAQQHGVEVVLCTGRRFRTARPLAHALQLSGTIVVHNGALVKEIASGETVQQYGFSLSVLQHALPMLQQVSSPLVYIDAFHQDVDILTEALERAHPFQREYLEDHLAHCRIVDNITTAPVHEVVMIGIMADADSLQSLRPAIERILGLQAKVHIVTNKNYRGHILEILHPTASKWRALAQLAAQRGITPEEIVAVGDDYNDLDMIRYAGLGIAMGNAVEAVREAADYVTGSNADDGLVQALERFVFRAS